MCSARSGRGNSGRSGAVERDECVRGYLIYVHPTIFFHSTFLFQ